MLRVGLIGIGAMGRGHLSVYQQLKKEGFPAELVAICDVDPKRFENLAVDFNLSVGAQNEGLSQYAQYSDYKEMIAREKLDYVDIALPTYLHAQASIYAMEQGLHVLCEKPMALNTDECDRMIAVSERTGRQLMIGHCLRFWQEYEVVKELVDKQTLGKCISADFFRGGTTPRWSFENWLLTAEKSGGCVLDQHVHDVDTLHWLFGMPEAVVTSARNVFPGSGYDAVSTLYFYGDKVVAASDDWSINGDGFGFSMTFRINFERGAAVLGKDGLTIHPEGEGQKAYQPIRPEDKDSAYTREVRYFCQCLSQGKPVERCTPASTRETIRIARAELASADLGGERIAL